jgi:hypothetical protein
MTSKQSARVHCLNCCLQFRHTNPNQSDHIGGVHCVASPGMPFSHYFDSVTKQKKAPRPLCSNGGTAATGSEAVQSTQNQLSTLSPARHFPSSPCQQGLRRGIGHRNQFCKRHGQGLTLSHMDNMHPYRLTALPHCCGPGRATYKKPTEASDSRQLSSSPCFQYGCHQPTLISCQPVYVRPAHFALPSVELLSK